MTSSQKTGKKVMQSNRKRYSKFNLPEQIILGGFYEKKNESTQRQQNFSAYRCPF